MPCMRNFSTGIACRDQFLNTKAIHALNCWINPVDTNMFAFLTPQLNLLIYFCLILLFFCLAWAEGEWSKECYDY